VDAATVEAVIAEGTRNADDVEQESVQVVPAFLTHKWRYDPAKRTFSHAGARFRLHADAGARVAMLDERLCWLAGRCARHENFRPPPPGVKRDFFKLHRVDELPSVMADAGARRASGTLYLIGMLTQPEDGVWCLEDSGRSVALEFEPGVGRSPGFFTETCVVLVQGSYEPDFVRGGGGGAGGGGSGGGFSPLTEGRLPGAVRVGVIVHPPDEPRAATLSAMGAVDTFRVIPTPAEFAKVAAIEATHDRAMFAVLSDVHVDSPRALEALRAVLAGFAAAGAPALFILMGNFSARPFSQAADGGAFAAGMEALAALLAEFPEVTGASHFVLVPGPGDPGAAPVLPRPALPAALCGRLTDASLIPRLTLATNPCRLRFYTQEIVVFRGEVSARLARASALPPAPPPAGEPPPPVSHHVVHTIVSQAHLLPLPLHAQPVYWEYDHALRLAPTPNAVVVGEDAPFWSHEVNGAAVFCPGSFAGDRAFAVYRPTSRVVEPCDLDAVEEAGGGGGGE
jgi:DNA polymerase epsilon subunit 2